MSDLWPELTNRQQLYLQVCYQTDQDNERREHTLQRRGRTARPEEEWRWMLYGPTMPASPLLYALRDKKLVNSETFLTFAQLENHGLILCRYTHDGMKSVLLYVQITPKGRALFRAAHGILERDKSSRGNASASS
jgi:hypothetical protein